MSYLQRHIDAIRDYKIMRDLTQLSQKGELSHSTRVSCGLGQDDWLNIMIDEIKREQPL